MKIFTKHKKLATDSGILIAGSSIGYALNYIFQLYMGRALGPEQYGILSALFAFFYIFGILSNTIFITASNFTARFLKKNELGKIKFKFYVMMHWVLSYGLLIYLIFLAFTPLLEAYTKIHDFFAFAILGITGMIMLVNAIYIGIFNGMQKFLAQVSTSSSVAFVKLFFGIILVTSGFGYRGGLEAVLISALFGVALAYFILRKKLPQKPESFESKGLFSYSSSVFLSTLFFTLIFTIDVIILKSLFSSAEVGIYSAGSMIGKLFFFATGIITTLIFPKLSGEVSRKKSRFILMLSLGVVGIGGVLYIALLRLFPRLIVRILYGSKYLSISPILWLFGGIFVLYSLNNLYRVYYYSRHEFRYANLAVVFLVLEVAGIYLFHSSLFEVVIFLLILNFIYFLSNLSIETWKSFR